MLFWLVVGHVLCDFPLQTDFMARYKNPTVISDHPWVVVMTAHCILHAGAVALITGSILLGCLEFAFHFWTDYHKCKGKYGMLTDQALHVMYKVNWAFIATLITYHETHSR